MQGGETPGAWLSAHCGLCLGCLNACCKKGHHIFKVVYILRHTCGLGSEPTVLSSLVTFTGIDWEEEKEVVEIWE